MSTPIDTPADAALTELAERFERWRCARRNGHARIPEDLWEQAVALSTVLSNGRVAKRLGLSPTDLRKQRIARQATSASAGAETSSAFIDITPSMPWPITSPTQTEIEFGRPDGARMCIGARGSATPLVARVRTFLDMHRCCS
jgi:hypothetical protein